jgi:hypothetical protein
MSLVPERECVLVNLADARRAIAEAKRVEDVKEIRDAAKAVEQYARERNLSRDTVCDAAEIKVRAERRMGEMLGGMPGFGRRGGDRRSNPSMGLEDLDITRMDSHRWQRIATIDAGDFDAHVAGAREKYLEPGSNSAGITTAGLLRLADPPEKKRKKFNLLAESKVIRKWLQRRALAWPEEQRPRFPDFVRRIIDRLEDNG